MCWKHFASFNFPVQRGLGDKLKPFQWRPWNTLCILWILNEAGKIWLMLERCRRCTVEGWAWWGAQHLVQPGLEEVHTAERRGGDLRTHFALMPAPNNVSSLICKVETIRAYKGFVYLALWNCLSRLIMVILIVQMQRLWEISLDKRWGWQAVEVFLKCH